MEPVLKFFPFQIARIEGVGGEKEEGREERERGERERRKRKREHSANDDMTEALKSPIRQ